MEVPFDPANDCWEVAVASAANGSVAIEILLHEGGVDAAWDAAQAYGCDERCWMTLARARQATHPTDAIPVHERAVRTLIDKTNANAYGEAVKLMARIEQLHAAAGDDGWPTYLTEITTRHRAKRSLLAKIHDRGWGGSESQPQPGPSRG